LLIADLGLLIFGMGAGGRGLRFDFEEEERIDD
jgi:hypothetical protein